MSKLFGNVKEESIGQYRLKISDLPNSFYGSKILNKRFDLINVNVNRAHPEPQLIRLALTNSEELIIRTNLKIGHYLEISVLIHLEECEQCRKSAMEDVKFY